MKWRATVDERSGRVYYYNEAGETQWEPPPAHELDVASSPSLQHQSSQDAVAAAAAAATAAGGIGGVGVAGGGVAAAGVASVASASAEASMDGAEGDGELLHAFKELLDKYSEEEFAAIVADAGGLRQLCGFVAHPAAAASIRAGGASLSPTRARAAALWEGVMLLRAVFAQFTPAEWRAAGAVPALLTGVLRSHRFSEEIRAEADVVSGGDLHSGLMSSPSNSSAGAGLLDENDQGFRTREHILYMLCSLAGDATGAGAAGVPELEDHALLPVWAQLWALLPMWPEEPSGVLLYTLLALLGQGTAGACAPKAARLRLQRFGNQLVAPIQASAATTSGAEIFVPPVEEFAQLLGWNPESTASCVGYAIGPDGAPLDSAAAAAAASAAATGARGSGVPGSAVAASRVLSASSSSSSSSSSTGGQHGGHRAASAFDVAILSALANKNDELPLLLCVGAIHQLCTDSRVCRDFFASGGVPLLQFICLKTGYLRSHAAARTLLLRLMARSPFVQEKLLDCWIDLASDMISSRDIIATDAEWEHAQPHPTSATAQEEHVPHSFPVHQALVSCRSTRADEQITDFHNNPQSDDGGDELCTIRTPDVSAATIETILRFMYSGVTLLPSNTDDLIRLCIVSHSFGVFGLTRLCVENLHRQLNSGNAQRILSVASANGVTELQDVCEKFIRAAPGDTAAKPPPVDVFEQAPHELMRAPSSTSVDHGSWRHPGLRSDSAATAASPFAGSSASVSMALGQPPPHTGGESSRGGRGGAVAQLMSPPSSVASSQHPRSTHAQQGGVDTSALSATRMLETPESREDSGALKRRLGYDDDDGLNSNNAGFVPDRDAVLQEQRKNSERMYGDQGYGGGEGHDDHADNDADDVPAFMKNRTMDPSNWMIGAGEGEGGDGPLEFDSRKHSLVPEDEMDPEEKKWADRAKPRQRREKYKGGRRQHRKSQESDEAEEDQNGGGGGEPEDNENDGKRHTGRGGGGRRGGRDRRSSHSEDEDSRDNPQQRNKRSPRGTGGGGRPSGVPFRRTAAKEKHRQDEPDHHDDGRGSGDFSEEDELEEDAIEQARGRGRGRRGHGGSTGARVQASARRGRGDEDQDWNDDGDAQRESYDDDDTYQGGTGQGRYGDADELEDHEADAEQYRGNPGRGRSRNVRGGDDGRKQRPHSPEGLPPHLNNGAGRRGGNRARAQASRRASEPYGDEEEDDDDQYGVPAEADYVEENGDEADSYADGARESHTTGRARGRGRGRGRGYTHERSDRGAAAPRGRKPGRPPTNNSQYRDRDDAVYDDEEVDAVGADAGADGGNDDEFFIDIQVPQNPPPRRTRQRASAPPAPGNNNNNNNNSGNGETQSRGAGRAAALRLLKQKKRGARSSAIGVGGGSAPGMDDEVDNTGPSRSAERRPPQPPQAQQRPRRNAPPAPARGEKPLPAWQSADGEPEEEEELEPVPMPTRPLTTSQPPAEAAGPVQAGPCTRSSDCRCAVCLGGGVSEEFAQVDPAEEERRRRIVEQRRKRRDPLENELLRTRKANRADVTAESRSKQASSAWRSKSNAFRDAIRNAREVTKAIEEGRELPPPIPSEPDPSLVPCPHCGRRFNAQAAERHIPRCKDIKAKPQRLARGGGVNASSGASRGGDATSSGRRGGRNSVGGTGDAGGGASARSNPRRPRHSTGSSTSSSRRR